MTLIKYLANLGYGSRRDVMALVAARRVTLLEGTAVRDGDLWSHDALLVDGAPLDPPPGTLLMLHKPVGHVCSTRDVPPLIYDLLPPRFLQRTPVMAAVGRLDRDTSGLLLLTDDGALNHRLTSPRAHVAKTYCAMLAHPLHGDEVSRFASGTLRLSGESTPLAPAALVIDDETSVRLTVTEGRYHQVRRMFAAVGNHVVQLHRVAIGALELGDLGAGCWREVTPAERSMLAPT
ncbi:MAG: rRNA pseudouridine synthase [Gemmatimonadaceae bacterium]|nr:rRNA pseudouridine synthase [Gemmatimonadaceae bacterium]